MTAGVGAGLRFDAGPSNPAYAVGDNEVPVQEALARYLKPGHVFYDVGANVGFFTVIGAKVVGPNGAIFAFEPVPEHAAYVRRNAKLNHFQNVTVIEKAISDSLGHGELLVTHCAGGAALSTATRPPDVNYALPVDLMSVDELVFRQKFPPPAVVKIDVEGVEINVLKGMSQTLREFKPVVIYEIDDGSQEAFQAKGEYCRSFLQGLAYEVKPLKDSYPGMPWLVGHAVAVPSSETS